jgi:hypothetical protein
MGQRWTYREARKFKDHSGSKFGRWLVIKRLPNDKNNKLRYLCECQGTKERPCGYQASITAETLVNRRSRSCGCLREDSVRAYNAERKQRLNEVDKADWDIGIPSSIDSVQSEYSLSSELAKVILANF